MGGNLTFKDLILVPMKNITKFYHLLDLKYSILTSDPSYVHLREIHSLFVPIEQESQTVVSPLIRENMVNEILETTANIPKKLSV